MLKTWLDLSMMTFEAQQVIALRMAKLASGGPAAAVEAHRMTTEKVMAATQASTQLLMGHSPGSIVSAYRKKVRANLRRLSK